MTPKQVLPLWIRVDLEVKAMKEYSTLPRNSETRAWPPGAINYQTQGMSPAILPLAMSK